jgi:hypothetical protein
MTKKGYQYVNLSDRSAEQHSSQEHVGVIVLATFEENRPDGCVVDHYDGTDNNALYCIKWATYSENNQADRRRKETDKYTTQYPVMDKGILRLQDPMVTWYAHPVHREYAVNEEGTHVRRGTNKDNYKLLRIRHKVFTQFKWVDVMVSIGKKDKCLNRFAVECFLGRELKNGEEADHVNRIHTDNSMSNLRARCRLFNANNKGLYRNNRTGVTGVCFRESRNVYIASVQMYTPDSPTISKGYSVAFSVKMYGKEGAFDMAVSYRKRHHLENAPAVAEDPQEIWFGARD